MPSLDELAKKHGTDKATPLHGYTLVYEDVLRGFRVKKEGRLLEIGVLWGASLKTWREWLPGWQIVGIDDGSETCGEATKVDGCTVMLGDAANRAAMSEIGWSYGPFDVVVDDGSHRGDDQIAALEALWPCVAPGGVYIIEDLHVSYQTTASVAVNYLKTLVDDVNFRPEQPYAGHGHTPQSAFGKLQGLEAVEFRRYMALLWKQSDA